MRQKMREFLMLVRFAFRRLFSRQAKALVVLEFQHEELKLLRWWHTRMRNAPASFPVMLSQRLLADVPREVERTFRSHESTERLIEAAFEAVDVADEAQGLKAEEPVVLEKKQTLPVLGHPCAYLMHGDVPNLRRSDHEGICSVQDGRPCFWGASVARQCDKFMPRMMPEMFPGKRS